MAIQTCVSTPRGYAIETTIVKTNGTRVKRFVITTRVQLAVFAAHQGIAFPCVGAATENMTAETGVMKDAVRLTTRRVLVSSLHVAMVRLKFVRFSLLLDIYNPGQN